MKELEKLFRKAGWEYKASDTYYLVSCPNKKWHASGTDRKPSCVVWPGLARFKCYACGHRGTIETLFEGTGIEVPEFLELDNDFESQQNILLDESILYFRKATEEDFSKPAFVNRGWSPAAIDFFDLRFDDNNNNLVFPVRVPELVGAVGRSAEGKRVHNYFGFFTGKSLGGYDKLSDAKNIAVVEGFTCLLNCFQWAKELGYDVVCTFTANVSDVQCRMLADTGKNIHLWLDQDKAGRQGAKRVLDRIDDIITVAEWDLSIGDVGKMSREIFFETFG